MPWAPFPSPTVPPLLQRTSWLCVCVGKVLTALTPHVGCRSFSTPWVVSGSKDKTIKVRFPCTCAPIAGRVT